MEHTLASQKVFEFAEKIANESDRTFIHHEHILMAFCRLINNPNLVNEIEADEFEWLVDFFKYTGIDSKKLHDKLSELNCSSTICSDSFSTLHSTRYRNILNAAEEHAQEDRDEITLQHILIAFHFEENESNIFKEVVRSAGGKWDIFLKYIGLATGKAGPFIIGQVIDNNYEIREVINSSNMGTVHLAEDHSTNHFVAIKTLISENVTDHSERSYFVQEAELLTELVHPHIVTVLQLLQPDNTTDYNLAIVMKYFPKGSLRKHLKDMSVLEILDVAIQICWAMEFLHKKNVIHKDLKPDNVLMGDDNKAYVSDFGLATENRFGGTAEYMPPEQWEGTTSPKSDIYSFGVLLFEALSGKCPILSSNQKHPSKEDHLYKESILPETLRTKINPKLENLILSCLAKNDSDRPEDFKCVEKLLIKIYNTLSDNFYKKHRNKPHRIDISYKQKRIQGWNYIKAGSLCRLDANFSEAERLFNKAAKIFRQIKDPEGQAASLNNIGNVLKDKGSYRTSLDFYLKSLDILQANPGLVNKIAQCYNNTANAFKLCGDNEKAMQMYQASLEIRMSLDDFSGMSACHNNIGALQSSTNRLEEAEKSYNEAINLCKRNNNKRNICSAYLGLGSVYLYQHKYDQSEAMHLNALHASQEIGNRTVEAKCYGGLGSIWGLKGDILKAEKHYMLAVEMAKSNNILDVFAQSAFELANLYNINKRFGEAEKMYHEALDASKQLNDYIISADCYFNLGVLLKNRKCYTEARRYFEKSINVCDKTNNYSVLAGNHLHLAELYKFSGDSVLSFVTFQTALRFALKSDDRKLHESCYFNLAIAYSERLDNRKSEELYQKCITIATDVNDAEMLAQCYGNLAALMLSNGDKCRMKQYAEKSVLLCRQAGIPIPNGLISLTRS